MGIQAMMLPRDTEGKVYFLNVECTVNFHSATSGICPIVSLLPGAETKTCSSAPEPSLPAMGMVILKEIKGVPSLLCFSTAELLIVPHAVTLHLIIFPISL